MKKTSYLAFAACCFLSINSCQNDSEISNLETNKQQNEETILSKNLEDNFYFKIESISEQIISDYENGLPIQKNSYLQNIMNSYNVPSADFLTAQQVNAINHERDIIKNTGIQNYMSQHEYSPYFKDRINDVLNFTDITNIESSSEFQGLSQNEKTRLSSLILFQQDYLEYYNNQNISAKGVFPPEAYVDVAVAAVVMTISYSSGGIINPGLIMASFFYNTVISHLQAAYPWLILGSQMG